LHTGVLPTRVARIDGSLANVFNHQPEKDLHALRRLDLLIHHHVKR
jgi:hypothetical protein